MSSAVDDVIDQRWVLREDWDAGACRWRGGSLRRLVDGEVVDERELKETVRQPVYTVGGPGRVVIGHVVTGERRWRDRVIDGTEALFTLMAAAGARR